MRLLKFLLPCLLLFAQQEASVHVLGHYGQTREQAQSPRKQVPAGKSCESCVAFAHIAGAVHSEVAQQPTQDLVHFHPQQPELAGISAGILSAKSRGPPVLL